MKKSFLTAMLLLCAVSCLFLEACGAAEAGNVIFNWIMLAALLIVFVIVSVVALEFIDRDKR